MIKRYSTERMTETWSELMKYRTWLDVELAVLRAMAYFGSIDQKVYEDIKKDVSVEEDTIELIEKLDKEIHHDLLAFVQTIQSQLRPDLRKYFHLHLTSYDTEEPALSMMLKQSLITVQAELNVLKQALWQKVKKYKDVVRIERTHGQHAEPSTLGLTFLWWFDQLERQGEIIEKVVEVIIETKISGAVGTYAGGLWPELEQKALEYLRLKPARISGQIILRDRHAQMICTLAVLAGVLENIALNIRLLGQTEICELEEPFGKKQKGSSRMPHKKNTILTENLCGLARIVRANAGVALENISTWGGRDISHSSAERVIFADSFQIVHFMIKRLTIVIKGLVVNEDRIKENLELTKGVIFSPEVKEFLMGRGFSPEDAYRISQDAAFVAIEEGIPYASALAHHPKIGFTLREEMEDEQKIFDLSSKLEHVDEIYKRFNL